MQAAVIDLLLTAEHGLLKGQDHPCLHILSPLGAGAPLGTAAKAAKDAAENITQVSEIPESALVGTAAPGRLVKGRLSELVILGLLIRVGQDGVRLVHFLEVLLRLGIPGVQVGVVLLGLLPVCPLDGVGIGVSIYTEYLIVISVCWWLFS